MVERWEGMVKTGLMASLLLCPHSRTLKKPVGNAVLFMGDSVSRTGDPMIEKLSKLENVAAILRLKLDNPFMNTWILEASRFSGPFACYDDFLPSISPHGDPLCYDPQDFMASRAMVSMLHDCLSEVIQKIESKESKDALLKDGEDGEDGEDQGPIPKTLLFGFSKGGVVLNQLLSEIAFAEEQSQSRRGVERKTWGTPRCRCLFPSSIPDFLRSIAEVHFIDVGLNCPGAYLTDEKLLESVVRAMAMVPGSRIVFHGTPRQWHDKNRPWIACEKNTCVRLLSSMAKSHGNNVQILEKLYFAGERPSLRMHFNILECLDLEG